MLISSNKSPNLKANQQVFSQAAASNIWKCIKWKFVGATVKWISFIYSWFRSAWQHGFLSSWQMVQTNRGSRWGVTVRRWQMVSTAHMLQVSRNLYSCKSASPVPGVWCQVQKAFKIPQSPTVWDLMSSRRLPIRWTGTHWESHWMMNGSSAQVYLSVRWNHMSQKCQHEKKINKQTNKQVQWNSLGMQHI